METVEAVWGLVLVLLGLPCVVRQVKVHKRSTHKRSTHLEVGKPVLCQPTARRNWWSGAEESVPCSQTAKRTEQEFALSWGRRRKESAAEEKRPRCQTAKQTEQALGQEFVLS